MLVEDDNNLREIYEARLLAEGYEIVSAQDGEEALALAVKEKPDLIIADIMMPKISGFDMLDILRSTPETKDAKVIMMTALSQAEDKERANKLGADRYLVKSQVTLEDVARVAREVLEGKLDTSGGQNAGGAAPPPTPPPPTPAPPTSSNLPLATPPGDSTPPAAASTDSAPAQPVTVQQMSTPITINSPYIPQPVAGSSASGAGVIAPTAIQKHTAAMATPDSTDNTSHQQPKTAVHTKVINPINDLSHQGADFEALVAQEEAKENAAKAVGSGELNKAVTAQVNVVDEDTLTKPDKVTTIQPTMPPDPNSIAL